MEMVQLLMVLGTEFVFQVETPNAYLIKNIGILQLKQLLHCETIIINLMQLFVIKKVAGRLKVMYGCSLL
jgi:hypothetical protein